MRYLSASQLSLSASVFALSAAFATPAFAQTASQQPLQQKCTNPATVRTDGSCPEADQTNAPAAQPGAPKTAAEIPSAGAAPGSQEVVVTGSRIAARANQTNGPVEVLNSADIEARGFNTLGDALNQLPAFGVPDSSTVGAQSSFGPGQSFVNFFGLGSQRTLTLVNGHRFVGSNTASIFGPTGSGGDQVDLNLIPTKLIDRTEIVAVGGAPIYGSDAISGTINVILKKDYQGLDLDMQAGLSDYKDAPSYRIRGLAGTNFAHGRGNVTIAGEYNQQEGLLFTDRALTSLGRYYDTPQSSDYPYTLQQYTDRRIPILSEGGIPQVGTFLGLLVPPVYQNYYGDAYFGGIVANQGVRNGTPNSDLTFDASGKLVPIDFGTTTSLVNASGGNGYSLTNLSNLLTNSKRYSGVLTTSYEFSDHIRLSGEGWYTHSEGTNLRDQPEYNAGIFGAPGESSGPLILSINNPMLSAAARQTIVNEIANNPFSDQNIYNTFYGVDIGQDYFLLDRANTDITTGRARGTVDVLRFVGSLDGDFNVGSHNWKWDLSANYGRSLTRSTIPTINWQNFQNAVGSITADNPNGVPCLAGLENSSGPTISSTCAPLNVFGSGLASQTARNYVTMLATPRSLNTQQDYVASLTGGIAKLPGGDLAFAVGAEHRVEHEDFNPSAAYRGAPDPDPTVDSNGDGDPTNDFTSYGQTVPIAAINAGYHTNELFGELRAPIVSPNNHIPFISSLEVQVAGREVNNSTNGKAFTWTVGGSWAPVRDIVLRGNYTRALRSPSITESQNPSQQYFGFADDPCDKNNIASGPNPTQRAANCLAAFEALGLTAGDLSSYVSLAPQRSFLQAVRGDNTLNNETANSWTVGAIVAPHFLRGFTLSADYVDIKVKGVITSLGADEVLSDCYDSTTYPNNQYCDRITRTGNGQNPGDLTYIVTGYVNADQLRYRGIVGQAQYKVRTPFLGAGSSLGFGASYQHLFELSSLAGGTTTHTEGDTGYSKDKGILSVAYDNKGFEFYTQFQYIGPAKLSVNVPSDYYPHNHVNPILFTNMAMSYKINNRFELRANVDNVFNTKPPFPTSGTSAVYFEGLEGRYYRIGAAVHF